MIDMGEGVVVREWVRFIRSQNIRIGAQTWIDDFVMIAGGRSDALTQIGAYAHVAAFSSILGGAGATLGDFVVLAPGCRLFSDSDEYIHASLPGPQIPDPYREHHEAPVTLGDLVLLGANTVVLPGAAIGEGASVGACSLVKDHLPPWGVYAGVPAVRIADRDRAGVLARVEAFLHEQS